MPRYKDQTGAALIMLIGVTAVLALLSTTLVFVIQNQQSATANQRESTQSFYAAEAAIDSAVQMAKADETMSTTDEWLDPDELRIAFEGAFPDGAEVDYNVYDNIANVNYDIKWDQGGPTADNTPDNRVWVEAVATYQDKTTRTRCLIEQTRVPFAEALPKAVTYSDTGIRLNDTSDIYAVDPVTGSPVNDPSQSYQTNITAGGTWIPTVPDGISDDDWDEVGRFTMNATADLRAPGTSYQTLGIAVNGSVAVGGADYGYPDPPLNDEDLTLGGRTFHRTTIQPGTVGFLSDYFDQAAQADLADESQAGGTPYTPVPMSPSVLTTPSPSGSLGSSLTSNYAATQNMVRSGNLSINVGTNARTLTFMRLYVTGNLTITGPATVTCTDLYVGGTLTIANDTTTKVTDRFGKLYVRGTTSGTGTSAVTGRVNINASPTRIGGTFNVTNSTTSATDMTTHDYGDMFCTGVLNISGNVQTNGSKLYGGGNITFTGLTGTSASSIRTHKYALVYGDSMASTTTLSNNVQLYSSETTLNGNFTISGASTAVKNWLGHLYVLARPWASPATGTISWSGDASVTSRDWQHPDDDPKPMSMGRKWTRTGDYDDEYGPTWVPGNSQLSLDFSSTDPSTVLCPLLCTTEQSVWKGNVQYGTRDKPMVFFFMCDNNGIYPMVFEYQGTGTYYGLMVINESTIEISNGVSTKASVQGAIFAGCPYDPTNTDDLSPSDIVLEDGSCVAYDQYVVGKIATSSLKTTTLITQIVPGSWQQLPVN